jgi:hypothetical protein
MEFVCYHILVDNIAKILPCDKTFEFYLELYRYISNFFEFRFAREMVHVHNLKVFCSLCFYNKKKVI